MKSYERKHLRMRLFHQNKNDWLLPNGPFFLDDSRNEIQFHFTRKVKQCNQDFFYDGLKAHFESQINTL